MTSLPPSLHPALAAHHPAFSGPEIELRRRTPPMTCSRCDITFIFLPEPPEANGDGPWVCPHCAA